MPSPAVLASNRRWRARFAGLALVLPGLLLALFVRQERRLRALAEHGVATTATVVDVFRQGGLTYTEYSYEVGGRGQTWTVSHDEAPHPVGATFETTSLLEDPSLSRPFSPYTTAHFEAERDVPLRYGVPAALFLFLAGLSALCHRAVIRAERGEPSAPVSPAAYRRRLLYTAVALAPVLLAITAFHARDAERRGESLTPVLLGGAIPFAIGGALFLYAARGGPERAPTTITKIMRWAGPALLVIAAIRLLALLASS